MSTSNTGFVGKLALPHTLYNFLTRTFATLYIFLATHLIKLDKNKEIFQDQMPSIIKTSQLK